MNVTARQREIEQLRALYTMRESRAYKAIAEQQVELERVQGRLSEQQALIKSIRDELQALHQLRLEENIQQLSATSLLQESVRRRWLTHDLEQEVFYLPGFENDVEDAVIELAKRRKARLKIRDQIVRLDELSSHTLKGARRVDERRESAMNENRRSNGVLFNG